MRRYGEVNFDKKNFLLFLLIFPFFKPGIFENIDVIDNIFNILRFASFGLTVALFCKQLLKSKLIIFILIMQIWSFFGTLLMGGSLIRFFMTTCINFVPVGILYIWILYDKKSCISSIRKLLNIYIIVNGILLIFFPNGIIKTVAGGCNLLDVDNLLAPWIFLSIALNGVSFLLGYTSKQKTIVMIIIGVIQLFILWVATAMVAIVIGSIAFILFRIRIKGISYSKIFFGIFMIIFVLIVVCNKLDIFTGILNALDRTTTLSGRTYIWSDFIKYISSREFNLFFGTGVRDGYYFYCNTLMQDIHTHNHVLFIILENGISGLVLWFFLQFFMFKKNKNKTNYFFLDCIYFIFLLAMLTEVYRNNVFFYFIIAISYYLKISDVKEEVRINESVSFGDLYGIQS